MLQPVESGNPAQSPVVALLPHLGKPDGPAKPFRYLYYAHALLQRKNSQRQKTLHMSSAGPHTSSTGTP